MTEQQREALEALETIGRAVCITRHGTIPITVEKAAMECFREEFNVIRNALSHAEGEALRYTHDGALAECPCCGSLDVGGADQTVNCYMCGLTVTRSGPLQNSIDAWNKLSGRTHPAPQVVFSDTQEEIEARLVDQLENSCPHCGGSGHKDDVAAPQVAVPEQRDDMIPEYFTVGECRGFRTGYNYLRDLLLAAAPTAPAGEPEKPRINVGSVGHVEQPVSDPDGLPSGLAAEAAKHLSNWLDMDLCECEGGHTCGATEVRRCRDQLLKAADAPAPDQREVMSSEGYFRFLRRAHELGGEELLDEALETGVGILEEEAARLRAGKEGQ